MMELGAEKPSASMAKGGGGGCKKVCVYMQWEKPNMQPGAVRGSGQQQGSAMGSAPFGTARKTQCHKRVRKL